MFSVLNRAHRTVSTVSVLVHESFGEHDRGLQNHAVPKREDVPNGAGHPYSYTFWITISYRCYVLFERRQPFE